jgi:hypothetical protein
MAGTGVLRMGATAGPRLSETASAAGHRSRRFHQKHRLELGLCAGQTIGVAGRQRLMRRNADRDDPA